MIIYTKRMIIYTNEDLRGDELNDPANDGPEVEIIRREKILAETGHYRPDVPNEWLPEPEVTDEEYKEIIEQLKQKHRGFPKGD